MIDPGLADPPERRHPSREADGPEHHVAALACEVCELLELLWGRDRDVPRAPLSASQLRALFVLERDDGTNLRALAEAMGSTPSSVSRLVDRLQAVGYVERAPSVASRRELQLYLTPQGREYLAELRAQREGEVAAVLDAMPARKRAALRDGLIAFRDTAAQRAFPQEGAGPLARREIG